MLVSLCIPTYNGACHIAATIQSILDSTHTSLEVIVSDDGSTDGTYDVVAALDDPRVRLFRNAENMGVPGNWNCALHHAQGDVIGLVNHDDVIGPFWLARALAVFRQHPHIGWISCAFHVIDEAGRIVTTAHRVAESGELSRLAALSLIMRFGSLGPGFLVRRAVLDAVGHYHDYGGPFADHDLYVRLAAQSPVYYEHRPHTSWRIHHTNLTHAMTRIERATCQVRIVEETVAAGLLAGELAPLVAEYRRLVGLWLGAEIVRAAQQGEAGIMAALRALARRVESVGQD